MDLARELDSLLECTTHLNADSRPIRLKLFHHDRQSSDLCFLNPSTERRQYVVDLNIKWTVWPRLAACL